MKTSNQQETIKLKNIFDKRNTIVPNIHVGAKNITTVLNSNQSSSINMPLKQDTAAVQKIDVKKNTLMETLNLGSTLNRQVNDLFL